MHQHNKVAKRVAANDNCDTRISARPTRLHLFPCFGYSFSAMWWGQCRSVKV
jgi:hypothetical protein